MALHASVVLDTVTADKAAFVPMTKHLDEVVYKEVWQKTAGDTVSSLAMQVMSIDIQDQVAQNLTAEQGLREVNAGFVMDRTVWVTPRLIQAGLLQGCAAPHERLLV